MYAVFGLKSLVIGVLALILLVFLGVTWQERPDDVTGLVSLLWRVASLTIGAIFLLGNIRPVFRWIWKAAEACSDSLFPDLTGIWKGQLRSNISVHEALQNAANSRERTFNAFDPDDVNSVELEQFEAVMSIKATLNRITVNMTVQGRNGESRSYSLMCKPRVSAHDEPHRLTYVYVSQLSEPSGDDESNHIGAAELEVLHKDGQLILSGFYWTARNWRNGRNTAGTLRFVRT